MCDMYICYEHFSKCKVEKTELIERLLVSCCEVLLTLSLEILGGFRGGFRLIKNLKDAGRDCHWPSVRNLPRMLCDNKERKIQRIQNWWQKLPCPHSKPSAKKNVLIKKQEFDEISKEELNELLVDFYPNARKKAGGQYKKSALTSIRYNDILCWKEDLTSLPMMLLNRLTKSLKKL